MHLTLGLALAVSAALGGSSLQTTQSIVANSLPEAQTVEAYVREYFADIPVMIAIAECESHFKQFNKTGTVLKNPGSTAVGVFQIMASIHQTPADEKLGIDIMTADGNMAYARHLYEEKGTKPWNASKACWSKADTSKLAVAIAK